jgi:polyisoprenoid-binding protein YceI
MSTDTITTPSTITKSAGAESIARGRWRIDPAGSRVEFRTPTLWGLATVKGHFERYEGSLDLQRRPAIELMIDAASLSTKNRVRDRHLRSADFFDVEHHPEVRFVSDTATLEGERLQVRGRLHAAGKSIPLKLDARLRRIGDELELDARTYADHRALGMSHGLLGMIPAPTELIVHGRLVQ